MTYEETYYGHRVLVTTTKNAGGRWTSGVEVPEADFHALKTAAVNDFSTEDEARRDAMSKAAEAIDRARQGQGKP